MLNRNAGRDRAARLVATMVAGIAAAGLLAGCGGSDEETGRTPSMLGASTQDASTRSSGSNSAPTISSIQLIPERPSPGRSVEARAVVHDEDGDSAKLEYRWQSAGGRLLGEGPRFDTAGLGAGERITVTVVASDGLGESAEHSRSVRLAEPSAQLAVVAIDVSGGQSAGAKLSAYIETTEEGFSTRDAEYEWQVNGKTVSTEDELETAAYSPGDVIRLRARLDREDGPPSRFVSSQPLTLSRGDAPEIVSEPLVGIEAGLFRYQMRAKSPSADAQLSYELLSGPQGMTVDTESGMVQWRPSSSQRGRFEIEVAVKDQWGSGVAQSFAIDASAAVAPPASRR